MSAMGKRPSVFEFLMIFLSGIVMKSFDCVSPGAVALVKYDNGRSLAFSYGVEDVESGAFITADSIFDLASVSKQFTAFSVLLLEKAGVLNLYDPIGKYIPEINHYAADVNILNLIYHTSGLPCLFDIAESKGISFHDRYSKDDILQGLSEQSGLIFNPGTKFEYSNTGYFLLYQIVERASGKRFADFLQEDIFLPLGMSRSFLAAEGGDNSRRVTGYIRSEQSQYEVSESPWDVFGASLVYSSVNDLMKWGNNFSTGQVGGRKLIDKMLSPLSEIGEHGECISDFEPYCFGLQAEESELGVIYNHQGSTFGGESHFSRSQNRSFTLAVLSNIEGYDTVDLAEKLCDGSVLFDHID